ncbi:MAG: Crp/Fnr family transcriptional regulator [Muribaculaceae bacterium]|nr:Crp/Fnr family transcriptional regulator [Muribaculaceae bacterium]
MTAELFNSYLENLDTDAWRRLCVGRGELLRFGKGECFAAVGEVARYVGYVRSGTLKYVAYSDDGTPHVVGLEFAGEFVADFPFSLRGRPATVAIIADSPCEIHCVPVRTVVELMEADPAVNDLVMRSTEALFGTVYERYMNLYRQTPRQRYNHLLNTHPDLFNLFSLKDIASYLDITPTHLSRLRRKV